MFKVNAISADASATIGGWNDIMSDLAVNEKKSRNQRKRLKEAILCNTVN